MRRMIAIFCLVAPIFIGPEWGGAAAPPAVAQLLELVAICPTRVAYQAMVRYQVPQADSLVEFQNHVIYEPPDKSWIQGLTPANRAGKIICKRGWDVYVRESGDAAFRKRESSGQRTHRSPRSGQISGSIGLSSPVFSSRYHPVELLRKNYDVRLTNPTEILGRTVQVVETVPRKENRTWVRAWIDDETGLVLRFERFDCKDQLTFSREMVTLELGKTVNPDLFNITVAAGSDSDTRYQFFSTLKSLEDVFAQRLVVPRALPDGYVLGDIKVIRKPLDKKARTIAHLEYWNGISSLSLFQREGDADAINNFVDGEMRIGGRDGKIWVRQSGKDCAVTLIGDLERDEMVRIFESIGAAEQTLP